MINHDKKKDPAEGSFLVSLSYRNISRYMTMNRPAMM